MSENTKIEWATHTFNPWEGCQKVGPGCDHCYAETRNARFAGGQPINWGPGAPRRRTSASTWNLPLRWNAQHNSFFIQHGHRQRVFCASLADWLDNAVDIEWLVDLLGLIRITPDLDWLLLSKRIGNWRGRLEAAAEWLRERLTTAAEATVALLRWIERWLGGNPPANVWLAATIVNQVEAERDIPKLLTVPAAKHFLSMEPLLGAVHIRDHWLIHHHPGDAAIDWVIVGGESGADARPLHPDWVRDLRGQCRRAGVPFLFKQWGEHDLSYDRERDDPDYRRCDRVAKQPGRWINLAGGLGFNGERVHYARRVGKKAAGRLLDGRTWDEVPG